MLEAVRQDRHAIAFAAPALQHDQEVLLAATSQQTEASGAYILPSLYTHLHIPIGSIESFWHILGVLGNWGRFCPFDVIFSANDSVFRAEHDPLLRTAYFLSNTRDLRVRKRCSTLKIEAR